MPKFDRAKSSIGYEKFVGSLGIVLSVGLVILGAIGLIFIQRPLQESQDTRKDASVADGQVLITTTASAEPFIVGQPATINVAANTHGLQTDGIELVFNVTSTANLSNLAAGAVSGSGLNLINAEVDNTSGNDYLFHVILVPPSATDKFSSNSPTNFLEITFTPTQAGAVTFTADAQSSFSTAVINDQVVDELKHVDPFTYQIEVENTTITCSYTYSDWGTCTGGTQTRTVTLKTPENCTTPAPTLERSCQTGATDDLYPVTSQLVTRFFTADGSTEVNSTDLKKGQTYQVRLQYQVQNTLKSNTGLTDRQITASLDQNNSQVVSENFNYFMLTDHQDGYGSTLQTLITTSASASSFTLKLNLDKNDVLTESDETNNTWSKSFSLADANNGTGGGDVSACNESCQVNSDCLAGLRCYDTGNNDLRCRLVSNVSSSVCKDLPDGGLNFGCNEYCADSSECASEFTCLENRCRRPDNPDNLSCKAPSNEVITSNSQLCNASCSVDTDCAVNLRCYQNQCRLATNLTSTSCSTTRKKIVTKNVYGTGGTTSGTKGGTSTTTGSTTKSSPKPTISPRPTPSPKTIASPLASPLTTGKTDKTIPVEKRSAWNEIVSNFQDRTGLSLPMLLIGVGGGLIILFIVISLIKRMKGSSGPSTLVGQTTPPSSQIHNLQQRIDNLQKQQTDRPRPSSSNLPQIPGRPGSITTTSAPMTANTPVIGLPQAQPQAPQAPQAYTPTPQAATPGPINQPTSGMISRVKSQGLMDKPNS